MSNIGFKLVVSFILVGSYFLLPRYGFTFHGPLINHFLYPLSHANVWHLSANLLCLWMLRCPPHIMATFVCAVLCSFLPCPMLPLWGTDVFQPTVGYSGALFAMVGISWGKIHRFRDMLSKNIWFLIITAFIPHVNFLIHLYCLLLGYLLGHLVYPRLSRFSSLSRLSYKFSLPCAPKSANS